MGCSTGSRLDGFIYYRLNADPSTLDPAYIVDVTGGAISAKIFNGLVRLDEDLKIVSDIAERWDITDGGRTYVFYLRKGVRFSNGREVSARDFVYSFRRVLSPETRSPNTWVLERILGAREYMRGEAGNLEGLEAPDNYILKIRLVRPYLPFLGLLCMTAAYVVPSEEVERFGPEFSVHPAGTGPFILADWKHNSQLVLSANEKYFGGKPASYGIVYRIIPEDMTAVTEFELGNLDVISVPSPEIKRYISSEKWQPFISKAAGLNTYYLGFNCSRPPFGNKALRKAVASAIDRAKILNTFYEGRGLIASGPVPPVLRHWETPPIQVYNPVGARHAVISTGIKDTVINFYVTSEQETLDLAEIIQSYLKAAGLNVRIRQLEWSAYKAAINNGEADMFWLSWWADYPDPGNFLFPLFHSKTLGPAGNRSRYMNPEVDRLIEAGQNAATFNERDLNYRKAEMIITEEVPWVFFWHKSDIIVRNPRLKNHKIFPIYSIDKGTEVSF